MFHVEHLRKLVKNEIFDIAVIGGGHAGVEAVNISTQFDLKVLLVTSPDTDIASAPCNPAVGGVGKGQVVRELDSLGGLMGQLADLAGIQFRTLNESKGFAVQSTRVQIDKEAYSFFATEFLKLKTNLHIARERVVSIAKEDDRFLITTELENVFVAKKVVLTTGTFLNGKLHTGEIQTDGGRVDSKKSVSLMNLIGDAKLFGGRFKTGTPARLEKATIDYSKMVEQESDPETRNFSLINPPWSRNLKQVSCFLTRTNSNTLSIIRKNKERSPIFNGQISGVGPRYCPSIEDKAFRYTEKDEHHVFVEPEGLNLNTIYPNGVSTSLPRDVQEDFLRTIDGLENCKIAIYGYAVEYDVVDTSKLNKTLESMDIQGLYFAGQLCGTSGYEEAAGQGFVAGVNAALSVLGRNPLILSRDESYIGVMIDDLVSVKRDEPYRLFTARSENRLGIREDNTFKRIAPYRQNLDLNCEIDKHLDSILTEADVLTSLLSEKIYYAHIDRSDFEEKGYGSLDTNITLSELLRRPALNPVKVLESELLEFGLTFNYDVIRFVAIENKYSGYIVRSNNEITKLNKLTNKKLDPNELLNSSNISFECKQRIRRTLPQTFGQLQKIEGIRPATLAYVAGNLL